MGEVFMRFRVLLLLMGASLLPGAGLCQAGPGSGVNGFAGGPALFDATQAPCTPQFELEPNDTAATATAMALPPPTFGMFAGIKGAIGMPGDADWYAFNAPAGARLWLAVDTGVAASGDRDSVAAVFGPDGTSLLEQDDDDGTGNGRDTSIESLDASLVAGLTLPTAGTYFARVQAKSPAATIEGYVLMVAVTSVGPEAEIEPNDTPPGQIIFSAPVLGSLSSAVDVDWYDVTILDFGIPFVVVDGDPERDGTGTDVVLRFDNLTPMGTIVTDSSGVGSLANPPAEGFAIAGLGFARVSGSGPGTYLFGAWYSGDGCPVPVELQGIAIR
jgi:Bacterial pre-peptidase C-terminal domain